jgi:hypothetical protein
MFSGIPFLTSPFPWVSLAAVAVGAAVSRATMFNRRGKDPERWRARKWVLVCLFISLAILLGLAALFIPGAQKILDIRLAYLAAGVCGVAFLAMRFKKALGIPILVLIILLFGAAGLFLQSVRAFTGETEIAKVRILSASSPLMKLELSPAIGETQIFEMEGEYFAPIVKVIIFDDFWVFLGAKTWYRFEGMTSFREVNEGGRTVFRQGSTDHYLTQPMGISENLYSYFEKFEREIPGVKTVQVNMDLKRAKELGSYSIRVQNDGGVEIIPLS